MLKETTKLIAILQSFQQKCPASVLASTFMGDWITKRNNPISVLDSLKGPTVVINEFGMAIFIVKCILYNCPRSQSSPIFYTH
jgi:hypothetical protein